MRTSRRRFLLQAGCGLAAAGGAFFTQARRGHAASAPFTHDTSVLVAARVAPEPFRKHWRACRGGSWPDIMRDQAVAHFNQRAAGLLYTLEAIRHLRAGDVNKALLLASARGHYLGDSSCIAHAEVWRPRAGDDVRRPGEPGRRVWSFLPAEVQDYWLPFGERTDPHYDPLLVGCFLHEVLLERA